MRFTWRRAVCLTAAAAAICLGTAGVATADTVSFTGDGITPISQLDFGTMCVPLTANTAMAVGTYRLVGISRQSSGGGTYSFANNAQVTMAVQSKVGSGLTAQLYSNQISLPSDWTSQPDGTLSGTVRVDIGIEFGVVTGPSAYSGSVTLTATGRNVNGDLITRTGTLSVVATISDTGPCAPDAAAPAVSVNFPAPAAGSNGWFNAHDVTPVVGTVTASDPSDVTDVSCTGGTVGDLTGLGTTTATGTVTVAGDGTHQVSCTATDGKGNQGAADGSQNSGTVRIDTTPPAVTDQGPASGPDGAAGWYVSPVTEQFTAADDTSGLADCAAGFARSSGTAEGSAVSVPSGPCTDQAGNVNAGVLSAAHSIDLTDPTVSCPPAPQFGLGDPGAVVSATVVDAVSGPASTQVSAPADTSGVGLKSVSLTGYDNAGRSTTVSCAYQVAYHWTGFSAPVDAVPTLNVTKAGSGVPVKFGLAGDQGMAILASGSPSSRSISCDAAASTDPLESTVSAGSSSLSYDPATDEYVYVWKTDKAWAGTCRQLSITLADGTTHTANFEFAK